MATQCYTGFHAVEEWIRHYVSTTKTSVHPVLYYAKLGPRANKIKEYAQRAGVATQETNDAELDALVQTLSPSAREHRGLVLRIEGMTAQTSHAVNLEQWLSTCPSRATVLLLDNITDPHNIGAILRSCDQLDAQMVIVPERRSVSNINGNETIARTSAGASSHIPISTVSNLVRAATQLKEAGFWLYGATMKGEALHTTQFAPKSCLVMGSEGNGIAHLLSKQCDTFISIPTCGKIDSLNVSVAAGILLYERRRQLLTEMQSSH